MSNSLKITETISISKDEILIKYSQMNQYFMDCIKVLYGKCVQGVDIKYFLPCNIINKRNCLSILDCLKGKTGVYIFIDNDSVPVYIGIGGQKVKATQNLKVRLSQELRSYCKENAATSYSKDSGATLSKNIQEIDALLTNKQVSPDDSVETIKSFGLITITVGSITDKNSVNNSQALESILIALFHPKYNK